MIVLHDEMIKKINKLKKSPISKVVKRRLSEFRQLNKKGNDEWFSELCFCILTANSRAATAIDIQEDLKCRGFLNNSRSEIRDCIKKNKHRFHNNKARFILEATKYKNIKDILKKEKEPREWLVKNIKGIGWKESSHFLRNVGCFNYAILDRHIIRLMYEHNYIKQTPKSLSKNTYLAIEEKFKDIANKLDMDPAELDLYMWYIKTGRVLK